MDDLNCNLLLIEDSAADAQLIQKALAHTWKSPFAVEWVTQLSDGLDRLNNKRNNKRNNKEIDAVLLDLFLPDSRGIETFDRVFRAAPQLPILVLASFDDKDIARHVLPGGAQDYLLKSLLDGYWLPRVIQTVIGCKKVEERCARKECMPVLR